MKDVMRKWSGIILLPAVLVLIMILCPPVFYLNDDVTIRSILSGAYTGTPDGHAVYMQYPLAGVLAFLYRIIGFVPWMEVFFVCCILGCMMLFAGQFPKVWLGRLLAIAWYVPFVVYMHYTLVAAMLAATAVFLLVTGKKGLKPYVLLLLSFLVRSQIGYLSLPFALCAILWQLCSLQKEARKQEAIRKIKQCAGLVVGMVLCAAVHAAAYGSAPWQEYQAYNDARTKLYDYTDFLSTGEYAEHYADFGMNRTEYEILYQYDTMLEKSVDAEKMQAIAERVSDGMKQKVSPVQALKESVYQYYLHMRYNDRPFNYLWLALVVFTAGFGILTKRYRALILLGILEAGRSVVWVYLLWRGRFPERVSLSLYLLELLLLLGMLLDLQKQAKGSVPVKRLALGLVSTVILAACSIQWLNTYQELQHRAEIQQDWDALCEYCVERPQTLFWMDVFSTVEYADALFREDAANMKLLGGWLSASPLTEEIFVKLKVADAAESLYDGEGAVLLASADRDMCWLEEYLQKRFGDCTLVRNGEIPLTDKTMVEYRVISKNR